MKPLSLLLLILLFQSAEARGRFWSYTLMGTAYDQATKDVLRNTALMIGDQLVTTDSLGHYTVTISGVTCDKGTRWQIKQCNEEAYGKLVVRRLLSEARITINSNWKQYAFCESGITPCYEQRRDLYVP
ncbi:MAG: hypothetical protein MUE88_03930 [Flavobacteriales bacterium]|nr:hypothetical protein [Flavobacteriales bacterium]